MALSQRLELKQGQSLVMTPQLQQAIKLLQLSNLELGEYVEGELERNPLLERDDAEPSAPEGASESADALAMRRLPKRSRARISEPPPISTPGPMICTRMKAGRRSWLRPRPLPPRP
jgi:DNA-directed RNA polymerase specialized sigma54-like protein